MSSFTKSYGVQRLPSPPPTLIRRYSTTNSSSSSTPIRPAANLLPLHNERERKVRRELVKTFKGLASTKPSSHIEEASYDQTLKDAFKEETRQAFQCSKIYALRNSPACIVWPTRPEQDLVEVEEPSPEVASVTSDLRVSSEQGVVPKNSGPGKVLGKGLGNNKRSSTDPSEEDEDPDEEEPRTVTKSHSNSSFWDNALGNIRIDSIHVGAPRRDPYNSKKWTRDQRRCFFLSNFIPPHQRVGCRSISCLRGAMDRK